MGHISSKLKTFKFISKAWIHLPSNIYKSALSCCRLLSSRHFTSSAISSSRSSNWTVKLVQLPRLRERQDIPTATSHLILSRIRKPGLSPEPRWTRLLMVSAARFLKSFSGSTPKYSSLSTNSFTISWNKACTDSDNKPVQSIFFTSRGPSTASQLESGTPT